MEKRTLRTKKAKNRNLITRQRSSQGLLGKVASSVKRVLYPSWLSQWMGGGIENDSSGGESSEEDAPQASQGSKRPRLQFDGPSSPVFSTSTQTGLEVPLTSRGYSASSTVPFSSSVGRKKLEEPVKAVSTSDNNSENSEGSASTSGCSSLISHKNKSISEARSKESNFKSFQYLAQNSPGFRFRKDVSFQKKDDAPGDSSRMSLWSQSSISSPVNKLPHRSPSISFTNQPSFRVGAFMSSPKPCMHSERPMSPMLKERTPLSSPARRMPASVTPYETQKNIRAQIRMRSTQGDDTIGSMSTAAKRIMQALDKISKPPVADTRMSGEPSIPSSRFPYTSRHRANVKPALSERGPPIADISTISKLTTLKNNSYQSRLNTPFVMSSTPSSLIEKSLLGAESTAASSFSPNDGSVGKIRSRLSTSRLSSSSKLTAEPQEVSLPKAPLSVSTLPTFSFLSKNKKAASSPQDKSKFTFASPKEVLNSDVLNKVSEASTSVESSVSQCSFQFSNPIESGSCSPMTKPNSALLSSNSFGIKSDQPKTTWTCSTCWIQNPLEKTKCMACETPKDSKGADKSNKADSPFTQTCMMFTSVKDLEEREKNFPLFKSPFGESKKSPTSNSDKKLNSLTNPSNSETVTSAPKAAFVGNSTTVSAKDLFAKSEKSEPILLEDDDDDILVLDSDKDCVVTPKTDGVKTSESNSLSALSKGFCAPGGWECDVCMVRNTADKETCIACETPKKGSTQSSKKNDTSASNAPGLQFNLTNGGFKFSVTPSAGSFGGVALPVPKPETNHVSPTKKETPSGSPFKFAVPKSVAATTNEFKFGISTSTVTTASAVFGTPTAPENTTASKSSANSTALSAGASPFTFAAPKLEKTGFTFAEPSMTSVPDLSNSIAASPVKTSMPFTFGTPVNAVEKPDFTFSPPIVHSDKQELAFSFGKPSSPKVISAENGSTPLKQPVANDTSSNNAVFSSSFSTGSFKISSGLKAAGQWECSTCCIRNEAGVLKCVACETPKPMVSEKENSASVPQTFQFGKQEPKSQPDSSSAFTQSSSGFTFSAPSSTTAPSFGVSSLTTLKTEAQKSGEIFSAVSSTQASTGFTFGAPTSTSVPSLVVSSLLNRNADVKMSDVAASTSLSSGFTFGTPITSALTPKSEDLKSGVPTFGMTTNTQSTSGFTFSAPVSSSPSQKTGIQKSDVSFGVASNTQSTSSFTFGAPIASVSSQKVEAPKTDVASATRTLFASPAKITNADIAKGPTELPKTTGFGSPFSNTSSDFKFGSVTEKAKPVAAFFQAAPEMNKLKTESPKLSSSVFPTASKQEIKSVFPGKQETKSVFQAVVKQETKTVFQAVAKQETKPVFQTVSKKEPQSVFQAVPKSEASKPVSVFQTFAKKDEAKPSVFQTAPKKENMFSVFQASAKKEDSPGFSFGSKSNAVTSSSSFFSANSFKAPSPPNAGFSFAAPTSTTGASGFKFGATSPASNGFSFGEPKTQSTPCNGFSFNPASSLSSPAVPNNSAAQKPPAFQFVSPSSSNTASPANASFSLGSKTQQTNPSTFGAPSGSSATFGAEAKPFSFGGSNANALGGDAKPVFSFGASTNVPSGGGVENKSGSAPFAFGATPAAASPSPFGQTQNQSNPFQIAAKSSSSNKAASVRKIRKAVRRN